ITKEKVVLKAASRTDAGVHAKGQVANFFTSSRIPAERFTAALNSELPPDIVLKDSREVPPEFDSRRNAISKTYCYTVLNRAFPSALSSRYAWFVPYELDIAAMEEAAGYFIGEHDFSSFKAADMDALTTIRRIFSFGVEGKGDSVEFTVRGNAFLRHMVRIMTGTLVSVGKGKLKPSDIKGIIKAAKRARATVTAPPEGLMLVAVEYRD
ncbi:MAG: tRNA pseudouridine(38-40) synthase TruA, partial [Deltaproteobacteria bacterium]|nr:tRNA pseudouridine(38-40) synthase TruA [Deltaproteobacteria bacterium]